MRIKTFIAVSFMVFLLGSICLADKPAIIGGIRGGTALGILGEKNLSTTLDFRFGFEADTLNRLGIVFLGCKLFLGNVNDQVPTYLSGGGLAYLGNGLESGTYLSLIFEKLFGVTPLFLETGIDIINSARVQFQVGYYI